MRKIKGTQVLALKVALTVSDSLPLITSKSVLPPLNNENTFTKKKKN